MPLTHADPLRRPLTASDWEARWAPYDQATYDAALAFLEPDDVVLDLGAGDLRFARWAAGRVRRVFAIERNRKLLGSRTPEEPANLIVICADALAWPIPEGITAGVLLMRHCLHYRDFAARLRAAGCRRLITNARWGMDVECVSLAPQTPYWAAPPGWYACSCGAVGFKTAPPQEIFPEALATSLSVEDCPDCLPARRASLLQQWSTR